MRSFTLLPFDAALSGNEDSQLRYAKKYLGRPEPAICQKLRFDALRVFSVGKQGKGLFRAAARDSRRVGCLIVPLPPKSFAYLKMKPRFVIDGNVHFQEVLTVT